MKCKVELLPTAWEDLKTIADYYALEFGAQSAQAAVDGILDTLARLEDFPDSGSATPDRRLNAMGYRMVLSRQYASIYKKVGGTVFIYHIANTKQDYPRLFY